MPEIWRTGFAAAAAVAVTLVGAGCGGAGPIASDCSPSHMRVYHHGPHVRGYVEIDCTATPRTYHATFTLQWTSTFRVAHPTWVDEDSFTTSVIPGPQGEQYLVTAECQPGRWRAEIKVRGVSSTGQAGIGTVHSPTKRIRKC